MKAKISVFVNCDIYLLLYNLHDSTFKQKKSFGNVLQKKYFRIS